MLFGKFYFFNILAGECAFVEEMIKPFIYNKILASFELIVSKERLFRTLVKVLNNILSTIICCPQGREPNDSVWVFQL